jgi:hypothetical protein
MKGIRVLMLAAALVGQAHFAFAWKPLTHAVQAFKTADSLPLDDPLRARLIENLPYLEAGSVGPDLFYALMPAREALLSDVAHYCKTSDLAEAMLAKAGGNPKLEAYALGWLSHNVADSVAHPWVNGFVGSPFVGSAWRSEVPGEPNFEHGHLEAWVNKTYTSQSERDAFSFALEQVAQDPDIPPLVAGAYEQTYQGVYPNSTCGPKWTFTGNIIGSFDVEQAAAAAARAMAKNWEFGAFADGLPGPHVVTWATEVYATTPEYLALTRGFTREAWITRKAPAGFNLDQGINSARRELGHESVFGPISVPGTNRQKVFQVPGLLYADGFEPEFLDRCHEMVSDGELCLVKPPGGDRPDDNQSAGQPGSYVQWPGMVSVAQSFGRLATKHGDPWALAELRIDAAGALVEQALVAHDAGALATARAARGAVVSEWMLASPTVRAQYTNLGRPDGRPLYDLADVALLYKGNPDEATARIEKWEEPVKWVGADAIGAGLVVRQPVLVVPTGGLYGLYESSQFRSGLEAYISAGGSVLVFSQQHGSEYSVLPTPDGRPIQGWGWFEDSSCYTDGAYIDTFHPILASQSKALVTSNIDGYFDEIPAESTVLLRRVKNGQPSMFLYPYGQGWVIVTSSYDDWGGFNQSGPGALGIVRDAIAWAKKPGDLPTFGRGSTAAVAVHVKNVTDVAASQVKLVLMDPSRTGVVAETTVSASVPAGGAAEVEFDYSFPANAGLGIYHVDYELLDDSGVTVQPVAEDDSGRVVVAKPPDEPYHPEAIGLSVVMPDGEDMVLGASVRYHYRLTNPSDHPRQLRVWGEFQHRNPQLVADVTVPAQGAYEADYTTTATWNTLWMHVFEPGGTPARGSQYFAAYVPQETGAWQATASKRGFPQAPKATVTATPDRPAYPPGATATVSVAIQNEISLPWDGTATVVGLRAGQEVLRVDQAFSVGPSAAATFQVSLPLPGSTFLLVYSRNGHSGLVAPARSLPLPVVQPDIRSVVLSAPAWRRTATNAVAWTVENAAPVPLDAGTLSAALENGAGAVVWEQTTPVTLGPGPGATAVLDIEVPPIPPDIGNGLLTVGLENGFGKRVEQRLAVRSDLRARVDFDAPVYDAGSSGEMRLTLRNQGTLHEEGTPSIAIDGIGNMAGPAYALDPGEETLLAIPFQAPAAIRGGLHRGTADLPGRSPVSFALPIPSASIDFALEDRVYQAGESVPLTVTNSGGVASSPTLTAHAEGIPGLTQPIDLPAHGQQVVGLPLPPQTPTGSYRLELAAFDPAAPVEAHDFRTIEVSGTAAIVLVQTDRPVYPPGGTVQVSATIVNGPLPLQGALLSLSVDT